MCLSTSSYAINSLLDQSGISLGQGTPPIRRNGEPNLAGLNTKALLNGHVFIACSNTTSQSNVCVPKIIYQSGSSEHMWNSVVSVSIKSHQKMALRGLWGLRHFSTRPDTNTEMDRLRSAPQNTSPDQRERVGPPPSMK